MSSETITPKHLGESLDEALQIANEAADSIGEASPGLKDDIKRFKDDALRRFFKIKASIRGIKGKEDTLLIYSKYDEKLRTLVQLFNDITKQIEAIDLSKKPEYTRVIYTSIQVMIIQLRNLIINHNNLDQRIKTIENNQAGGVIRQVPSHSIRRSPQRIITMRKRRSYSKKIYNKRKLLRRNTPAHKDKTYKRKKIKNNSI